MGLTHTGSSVFDSFRNWEPLKCCRGRKGGRGGGRRAEGTLLIAGCSEAVYPEFWTF